MTMLALARPYTHWSRGSRSIRSAIRRSLVQPANSITAAASAAVATVSNRPIGGKRDGTSRCAGRGAATSFFIN